ncbi:MAG: hypothetical protein WCD47_14660 [Candidatus Sulfotelmatobacter sp.]
MSDETLMKPLLNAEKTLADRLRAIEEITRSTQPIEHSSAISQLGESLRFFDESSAMARVLESARLLEENSALKQLMDSVRLNQELTRTALGPAWELRQAGLIDPPWHREFKLATDALAAFQDRFRLPEIEETAHLLTQFRDDSPFEKLTRYYAHENSLQRAMESMRTPWLDAHEAMKSMAGFAEIQGIGHALRSMPTFDEDFAVALRRDLGDWRDAITWPDQIFTDLAARAAFYTGLGFNAALTDFPLPAFEQSLDIARLRSDLPPLVEPYGSPARPADRHEEEGLSRTNTAHDRLLRLERLLRKFIDEQMTRTFGTDWPKHRLPNGLYDHYRQEQRAI